MPRPTSHRSPESERHDAATDPTESEVTADGGRPAGVAIAKIAALFTASMLLVGAIAAAAVTTSHRKPHSKPSSAAQGAELTGARALDVRSAAAYAAPPDNNTPESARQRTTTTSTTAAATPLPHRATPNTSRTPDTSAATRAPSSTTPLTSTEDPDDVRSFVQNFYHLLDVNPQDALELVSRELVADAREELIRSWESMHDVVVRKIDLTEDGSVLAVISMRDADDRQVRISQLLDLSGSQEPRISGARVLSVQRN